MDADEILGVIIEDDEVTVHTAEIVYIGDEIPNATVKCAGRVQVDGPVNKSDIGPDIYKVDRTVHIEDGFSNVTVLNAGIVYFGEGKLTIENAGRLDLVEGWDQNVEYSPDNIGSVSHITERDLEEQSAQS